MLESNADEVTEQLKGFSTLWRDVYSLTDEQLYTQIRNDEIDILVDLAGYAGKRSRMPVFARKASQVQVTYLAYPNTTGLTRMDYRIVDEFTDPTGIAEVQSSEKLVRLSNSFLCYQPEELSPLIEPLPADNADIFTFGSFNNYMKITDDIIDAWSKILSDVPNSQLYVKALAFADQELQNHFVARCKAVGIERKRLLLSNPIIDQQSHLSKYNKVDLHLDTYPYNGTTTTLEAMWMGVPTLTWAGGSHRSRVGHSIMSNLGLADYVAQTKEEYIDLAVSKANDLDALRTVRAGSRARISTSAIMDSKSFIKELEGFYLQSIKELESKGEL
jgi:predicted O-linked N-acetylglucosamine transferase (SPINDLY family)